MVDLDQGQRVEDVAEELQESDLEEEPVGWHSVNSYFLSFSSPHHGLCHQMLVVAFTRHHMMVVIRTIWLRCVEAVK